MKKSVFLFILFVAISCQNEKRSAVVEINTNEQKMKGLKMYNFYRDDGSLEKTLEYINLCGKEYLNQGIYYDTNKDTIFGKSNFYKIYVQKNILNIGDSSKIKIKYEPLLKNSISGLLLSRDNVDLDYCNLNSSKLDTLFFIDNEIEFYQAFKNKGEKTVGGYILEIDKDLNKKVYDERKVYVIIPFEVR
jgi:hypothetical protein